MKYNYIKILVGGYRNSKSMYSQLITVRFSLLTTLMFVSFLVNGQGPKPGDKLNHIPTITSPNASAIEKFVEFPAASYTGVPNISIPFYTIKIKGAEIPIGLSYHASGNKVDDVASDVGLGWSLNATGLVSILNNGILDEISGYPNIIGNYFEKIKNLSFQQTYEGGMLNCGTAILFSDPIFGPDPFSLYGGGQAGFLTEVIKDLSDSEPDVYTFSFGNRTGKFFTDENGVFKTIPYSNISISRIVESGNSKGYKIVDESGTAYEFTYKEEAFANSISDCNIYGNAQNTSPYRGMSRSYYLTRIQNIYGERIEFFYTGKGINPTLQKTFSRAKFLESTSPCWELNAQGDLYYNCTVTNTKAVTVARLDSVKSSSGVIVKFNYSTAERIDLPGANALTAVEVWSNVTVRKKIKTFDLSYDYFGNSTATNTGDRLRLLSVTEQGKPAYNFSYNNVPLPPRLSYAQDHYGYFNGKTNTTLLPVDDYHDFSNGADRTPDSNYTIAGILEKITYPTGGHATYKYEPNSYYLSQTTIKYNKGFSQTLTSVADQVVSTAFTITSAAKRIKIFYNNTDDGTQTHNDFCKIKIRKPGFERLFFGVPSKPTQISLDTGSYILEIETVGSTYNATAFLNWLDEVVAPPHEEISGGVRIKEVLLVESQNAIPIVKRYEYVDLSTGLSSGVQLFKPEYIEYKTDAINRLNTFGNGCNTITCDYYSQSSSSITPLSFSNGAWVHYNEVLEYTKSKTENGFIQSKYMVSAEGDNLGTPVFPFAPRVMFDWVNGSLKEQSVYGNFNGQYKKISALKNYYNYTNFNKEVDNIQGSTYGAKIAVNDMPFVCWMVCNTPNTLGTTYSRLSFGIQRYQLYSSWHRLDRSEETLFDQTTGQSIVKRTKNSYPTNGFIQPSIIERNNSKGELLKTVQKFPYDYDNDTVASALLEKNRINTLLERVDYNGAFQLYKEEYKYKLFGEAVYDLSEIKSYTGSGNGVSEEKMIKYDSRGNLLEYKSRNGLTNSLLWGYNFSSPIASVSNASLENIAFSSFETDDKGNWVYETDGAIVEDGVTGNKSFSLSSGNSIQKENLDITLPYTLTYWLKDDGGTASVGGTALLTRNNWTLYQVNLSGVNQIIISGTGIIDELRLIPKNAQMTTYTYEPIVGMVSQCDPNNRITYYEYDLLGRLKLIRDQDKNIIKTFQYNYQQ